MMQSSSQSRTVNQSTFPPNNRFRWGLLIPQPIRNDTMVNNQFIFPRLSRNAVFRLLHLLPFLRLLWLFRLYLWKEVGVVYPVLDIFRQGNGILQVFLDQHAGDRSGPGASVSGVLNHHGDSYLRIIAGSKREKDCMILTMGVLCGACLSAHFDVSNADGISCAARHVHRPAQAFNDRFIIPRIHAGIYFFRKFRLNDTFFTYGLDQVWAVIKATV